MTAPLPLPLTLPMPPSAERIAALESMLSAALKFLGHDAREGHSSTLALLELQRLKPDPMPLAQLSARVEANSRRALAAIDDFTELARARTEVLHLEDVNLADLVVEAIADAWTAAGRRGVRIQVREHADFIPGQADRDMLARALTKLLRDAVEGAPRGSAIGCALVSDPAGWCFELDVPAPAPGADRGPREAPPSAAGRALAGVVAERHGGGFEVELAAAEQEACRFRLSTYLFPVSASSG